MEPFKLVQKKPSQQSVSDLERSQDKLLEGMQPKFADKEDFPKTRFAYKEDFRYVLSEIKRRLALLVY